MLSAVCLVIFGLALGCHGSNVNREWADSPLDLVELFQQMTYTDAADRADPMTDGLGKLVHFSCKGDECHLCVNVNVLGKVCLDLSTPNDTVKAEITKHFLMFLSVEFVNKTPKLCAFHMCVQLTDLEIEDGKICLDLEYNGRKIFDDICCPLMTQEPKPWI